MSLLILAMSLLDYSNKDATVAEQHHRCGLEVRELMRMLRNKPEPVSDAELDETADAYNRVMQKYSINNADVDFRRYQLDHPDEFPLGAWDKFKFTTHLLFFRQGRFRGDNGLYGSNFPLAPFRSCPSVPDS